MRRNTNSHRAFAATEYLRVGCSWLGCRMGYHPSGTPSDCRVPARRSPGSPDGCTRLRLSLRSAEPELCPLIPSARIPQRPFDTGLGGYRTLCRSTWRQRSWPAGMTAAYPHHPGAVPAVNTPRFSWVLSRPPPIHQPARAVTNRPRSPGSVAAQGVGQLGFAHLGATLDIALARFVVQLRAGRALRPGVRSQPAPPLR